MYILVDHEEMSGNHMVFCSSKEELRMCLNDLMLCYQEHFNPNNVCPLNWKHDLESTWKDSVFIYSPNLTFEPLFKMSVRKRVVEIEEESLAVQYKQLQ